MMKLSIGNLEISKKYIHYILNREYTQVVLLCNEDREENKKKCTVDILYL